jgi:DNA-binding beta-propeller fold protein YncE
MLTGDFTKKELDALDSVQFSFVNNTNAPLSEDLFNTDTLVNSATEGDILPPTSITNDYFNASSGVGTSRYIEIASNGNIYQSFLLDSSVLVFDSEYNLITQISLGFGQPNTMAINTLNNTLYVTNFNGTNCWVIDLNTNTIIANIVGFANSLRAIEYCPTTNEMWISTVNFSVPIQIVDCATNTIVFNVIAPPSQPQDFSYDASTDSMFATLTSVGANDVGQFNCQTKLIIQILSLPNPADLPISCTLCGDFLYVGCANNPDIFVFHTIRYLLVATIPLNFANGSIYGSVCAVQLNKLYFSDGTNTILYEVDATSNLITNTFLLPVSIAITGTFYSSVTNSVWVADGNRTLELRGANTPFYITGSTDYNCFVRNIETEPIRLLGMWVISKNQIQLSNPLNIKKRSADGNSNVMPDFPINQVSTYQEQGNRAFIKFGRKLIFDGRTFFSNYTINANQEVTFILLYDEFNRANFSMKEGWFKKPLFYGVTGDRDYVDVTHNEVRHKYDENYDG